MTTRRSIIALVLLASLPMATWAAESSSNAAAAPALLPNATTRPSPGEQLFNQGRDALYRRDYPKAIELLTSAAAMDKNKTSYRLHLARALQYAGQSPQAQELLVQILKTNPDHVEAGLLLGEIYATAENWRSVVSLLQPLLKYRHDYQIYHLLADAQYNLGQNDSAREYLEEAIKLNPQSAVDHYQLGNIYLGGNLFALAAESYQNALRLGLKSPVLHYKLGSAYFNLHNYFGNIATVTVKSGQPGTINGQWFLIDSVPGQKDSFRASPPTTAIYQIAQAMDDGLAERPDIQFLRANIYLNAGRFEQAYGMYKQMRNVIPQEDLSLFYYYYAQAAFGAGQFDEYLTLLDQAIVLNRPAYEATLVDAYLKVAEQYNQAGNLTKYIDYLTKAVHQSPQTAALHLKLGNAYQEAAKPKEAALEWQMVLDLEPDHPRRLELLTLIARNRDKPITRPAATTRP